MSEEVSKLETKRSAIKRQLKAFFAFVHDKDNDTSELRERYERIHIVWDKFSEMSLELEVGLVSLGDESKLKELVHNCEVYEAQYYETMAAARTRLQTVVKTDIKEETTKQNSTMKIKLSALTIQPFKGEYENWLSFKDAFTTAVHDQDLPDVQKFQILRGLLKDDALKVISALEATDANYPEAWQLLEHRYANTRLIINTHMKGLFEYPVLSKLNHNNLRSLIDTVRTHIRSSKSLRQPVEQWDTMLIYLVTSKLDQHMKEEWERDISVDDDERNPSLEDLLKFLERRCLIYEMTDKGKAKTDNSSTNATKKEIKKVLFTGDAKKSETACSYCNDKKHKIYRCEKFMRLSTDERNDEARKHKLCMNCLRQGHWAKDCRSTSCQQCGGKHNTLLHKSKSKPIPQPEQEVATEQLQQQAVLAHYVPKKNVSVILSTARVYIQDSDGRQRECRAVLDPGSQVDILTEEFARKLNLKCETLDSLISGVQATPVTARKSAKITIKSTVSRYSTTRECLVLPKITDEIPQFNLKATSLVVPAEIELADPDFDSRERESTYWSGVVLEVDDSRTQHLY